MRLEPLSLLRRISCHGLFGLFARKACIFSSPRSYTSTLLANYRKAIFVAFLALPLGAQPRPAVPSVTSYSLDKVKVTFPDDLAGQQNVLILYFQPDQSEAAVAWSTALQPVKYAHPEMQTYILPVYPRENILYRWWIGASLRSGAPPAQEWRSTVPIFVDKSRFLAALGINSEKQFVVLLTDKAGHVEWRADGPLDGNKFTSLVAAVSPAVVPTAFHAANRVDLAHSVSH
jgi:hypothetical protein